MTFTTAKSLALELKSPNCINWEALECYYNSNGKDATIALINKEREGANGIYNLHLDLASKAVNLINIH